MVLLTIASVPESLDVLRGSDSLGKTPGPIPLLRGETPVSLTFQTNGYAPKTLAVVPRENLALSVTLTPVAKPAARRAAGRKVKDLEF